MSNPDQSVFKEVMEMLGQIDPADPDCPDGFIGQFPAMLRAYREKPGDENFIPLIQAFERFLTLQHKVYLLDARSRYRPSYRKGRII